MGAKLRTRNPQTGEVWIDTDSMTSRVVGRFVADANYSTSDPHDSGGYHRTFPCPPGTSPFAFCFPINEQSGVALVTRIDGNTARLDYALPAFANGGRVQFIYGYGTQR